jgi:hypothetical protein
MLCLAQLLGNTPLTTSRQHNCNLHAMLGTPHTEHAFNVPPTVSATLLLLLLLLAGSTGRSAA